MLIDIAKQVNWLDLVAVILLIRICYIAGERGFFSEVFKVLGVAIGVFLACENFNVLGNFIADKTPIPAEWINVVSFIGLIFFGYYISTIIRELFLRVIKKKEKLAAWDRFFAMLLGAARFALVFSLLITTLRLTGLENFRNDARSSFLAPYFNKIALSTHDFIFKKIIKKFQPKAQPNRAVNKILN